MTQLSSFGCVHLSHQGRLCTSPTELYFISAFYRADILWPDVVGIEIITKNHNGKPISMLSVKTRGSVLHFHTFRDIQSAEQQLRKCLQRTHNQQVDSLPQSEITIEPQSSDIPDKISRPDNSTPTIIARSNYSKKVIVGCLITAFATYFLIPQQIDVTHRRPLLIQSIERSSWWSGWLVICLLSILIIATARYVSSDIFCE